MNLILTLAITTTLRLTLIQIIAFTSHLILTLTVV